MILKFLTETINIANQLGVPDVSTDDMTNKVNGIFGEIQKLFSGSFGNIAMLCLIISVIVFIFCAAFHKKGLKPAAVAMIFIIVGILLFANINNIIGWVLHIAQ
ncbi:TPA: hypothetical protein ACSQRE_000019 [Clostridium perfringens]